MVREYEIQHSISEGVAKVLRGEVSVGMDTLRAGQKRGVKFEIIPCDDESETTVAGTPGPFKDDQGLKKKVDIRPKGVNPLTAAAVDKGDSITNATNSSQPGIQPEPAPPADPEGEAPPGHCTGCRRAFTLPTSEEEEATDSPLPLSRDTPFGLSHCFIGLSGSPTTPSSPIRLA
jgi:vacuolar protein sorting-associated protein 41